MERFVPVKMRGMAWQLLGPDLVMDMDFFFAKKESRGTLIPRLSR